MITIINSLTTDSLVTYTDYLNRLLPIIDSLVFICKLKHRFRILTLYYIEKIELSLQYFQQTGSILRHLSAVIIMVFY